MKQSFACYTDCRCFDDTAGVSDSTVNIADKTMVDAGNRTVTVVRGIINSCNEGTRFDNVPIRRRAR